MLPTRVLLAEDEPDVATVVTFSLRTMWPDCEVTTAKNGALALQAFAAEHPDLVILDLSIPPPNGVEVCRRLRAVSTVPIMILTVRDTIDDKLRCFDLGADDYLTKPFDHLELLARLRALLRRSAQVSLAGVRHESGELVCGPLRINAAAHVVRNGDYEVALTATEFRLLEVLALSAGMTVPHETLLRSVWGEAYAGEIHYLKVFIRRLRQKLGDTSEAPQFIQSVRGVGYRMLVPEVAETVDASGASDVYGSA